MQSIGSVRIWFVILSFLLIAVGLVGVTPAQEVKSGQARGKAAAQAQHVREVQEALAKSGYDPGPIDGIMGPRTRAALRKYVAVPPPQVPTPADQVIARFRTERREGP
jgi:hypothetical protein